MPSKDILRRPSDPFANGEFEVTDEGDVIPPRELFAGGLPDSFRQKRINTEDLSTMHPPFAEDELTEDLDKSAPNVPEQTGSAALSGALDTTDEERARIKAMNDATRAKLPGRADPSRQEIIDANTAARINQIKHD